jgi:hypothetical protein
MARLVPAIHVFAAARKQDVDARHPSSPRLRRATNSLGRHSFSGDGKAGHDESAEPPSHRSAYKRVCTIPRRNRARVIRIDWPSENRRGRRECWVMASPMARLQQKKQAAVTTGSAGHRHSLRNGVTAYIALSLGNGLSCPHRPRDHLAVLASASGGRDHTTSPSASATFVRRGKPRPSHPRPTVRDDRPKRPSSSRRDARDGVCDLPDEASVSACDRLARRAKWAWGVCGIGPSCHSGNVTPA